MRKTDAAALVVVSELAPRKGRRFGPVGVVLSILIHASALAAAMAIESPVRDVVTVAIESGISSVAARWEAPSQGTSINQKENYAANDVSVSIPGGRDQTAFGGSAVADRRAADSLEFCDLQTHRQTAVSTQPVLNTKSERERHPLTSEAIKVLWAVTPADSGTLSIETLLPTVQVDVEELTSHESAINADPAEIPGRRIAVSIVAESAAMSVPEQDPNHDDQREVLRDSNDTPSETKVDEFTNAGSTGSMVQSADSSGAEVDVLPRKMPDNAAPVYPADALASGIEGRVILRVHVGVNGRVQQFSVYRSSGSSSLDRAAIDAVRHWRFEPGRRNGLPVALEVAVPIRFSIAR